MSQHSFVPLVLLGILSTHTFSRQKKKKKTKLAGHALKRSRTTTYPTTMGQMHVLPSAAHLAEADEKCDPIADFVPLTEDSPKWEKGAKLCNDCGEPFDVVFVRKHHCRMCGQMFCERCAPRRHILSKSRGCMKCTGEAIIAMKDRLLEEHQRNVASPTGRKKGPQPSYTAGDNADGAAAAAAAPVAPVAPAAEPAPVEASSGPVAEDAAPVASGSSGSAVAQ